MKSSLKWAIIALTPVFFLLACEKETTNTGLIQNEEAQAVRFASSVNEGEESMAAMSVACGTPANVSGQWYWSNGCNCNVKFKCGAVPQATLYTWEIHQVFSWGIDTDPFFVKNTTTNSWNWGGGYGQPEKFQVWVKAKCPSGYGEIKKSVTIVPPPCCAQL